MINDEDANLLNRLSDLMNKKYSAECSEAASNAHDRLHALLEQNYNLKNELAVLKDNYSKIGRRFKDEVLKKLIDITESTHILVNDMVDRK